VEVIDLDTLERAVRNEMPADAALILQLIERCRVAEGKHVPLRLTIYADIAKCAVCSRNLFYQQGKWVHDEGS